MRIFILPRINKKSTWAPMILGVPMLVVWIINWHKNGSFELGLFLLGIIPIALSVLLTILKKKGLLELPKT